jgi:chromosome partitioning protein
MHTIALVSRKGGTGKSTLAIGMAIAAVADGHKVCLLEADPLGTLSNWRRRRVEPSRLSRPFMTAMSSPAASHFSRTAA